MQIVDTANGYFVGIDPGITGGICVLSRAGALVVLERFNGSTPTDVMRNIFGGLGYTEIFVALESVHARPGQGVCSMFTFGVGYGRIQGFLDAHLVDYKLYPPQAWQRFLPQAATPKDRVRAWAVRKFELKDFIFEGCRVPHQGCMDAAGIAEYHRCIKLELLSAPKDKKRKKKLPEVRF